MFNDPVTTENNDDWIFYDEVHSLIGSLQGGSCYRVSSFSETEIARLTQSIRRSEKSRPNNLLIYGPDLDLMEMLSFTAEFDARVTRMVSYLSGAKG